MKIVLIIILGILLYQVGKFSGEENTLKRIKKNIECSKNWDEFLAKFSKEWIKYEK